MVRNSEGGYNRTRVWAEVVVLMDSGKRVGVICDDTYGSNWYAECIGLVPGERVNVTPYLGGGDLWKIQK